MSSYTHEASGAKISDPQSFDSPDEFLADLLSNNADANGLVSEEKFVGLGFCLADFARAVGESPERDLGRMIKDMAGPFGQDKEKCKQAAADIYDKASAEVIPFVASRLFKMIDRDSNRGLDKEEMKFFFEVLDGSPREAFKMVFKLMDRNGDKSLDAGEIATFFNEILKLGGNTVNVFVNVFAATFKDEMIDGVLEEVFSHLDENGDDKLDEGELAMIAGGFEQMKMMYKEVTEMNSGGPMEFVFQLIQNELEVLKAAGDMNQEQFCQTFENLLNKQLDECLTMLAGEACPVPDALLEEHKDLINGTADALKAAFASAMRGTMEAYFNVLDANSDGVVSQEELGAITGLIDPDMSGSDCFARICKMVEGADKPADAQGVITKEEAKAFMKKLFDLGTSSIKGAVEFYLAVLGAISEMWLSTMIKKIAGGDALSEEKFAEIAEAFSEDGPEVLLAPLME